MIFDINVSILFTELAFTDRFAAVRSAGFGAVECWWPEGEDLGAVRDAVRDSRLDVVALNFDAGDMPAGDRGLLSDLDRHERFRDNAPVALELAAELGCTRLNALVGTERPDQEPDQQLALALANVRWAADLAAAQGAEVLIEPINRQENGPYLLGRTDQAVTFIERVDRPNVRLLYDAYHAQRSEGDLISTARRHFGGIGHVQIADSPHRHEPGTGEINFRNLLSALEDMGYRGHVGLEYKPRASTQAGLGWLPASQRSGEVDLAAVFDGPVEVTT